MLKKGIAGGIVFLHLLGGLLFSQTTPQDVTDEKIFYQAHFLTLYDRWEEALPLYLDVMSRDTGNANLQYLTGICYLHIPGLRGEAIPWLEKATGDISKKYREGLFTERHAPREAWLMLGRAYQITGALDRAMTAYDRYLKSLKKRDGRQEADLMIQSCERARKMLQEKPDLDLVEPELLKVSNINYHPAVSGDGRTMVFMSDARYYHAIYDTRYVDGAWLTPRNITMDIQSDGTYRVASLNRDGTLLFLTVPGKDNYNIYVSRWMAGEQRWGKAVPLKGRVNTLKNEIFASLSPDGQQLYFVSDRAGGEGGYDIFTARRTAGDTWDDIRPLGPPVNSSYDERSPIVTDDGNKLYFSSNGPGTMGGFDIFVSEKKAGQWSQPVNLGHPPNTTDDDLFYAPTAGGQKGYFTRYSTHAPKYAYITMAEFFSADHPRPVVVDGRLQMPGERGLPEDLCVVITRAANHDTLHILLNIADNGTFRTSLPPDTYVITVSSKDLHPASKKVVITPGESTAAITFSLQPLTMSHPQPAVRIYTVHPVHFAFNKYTLSTRSKNILDSLAFILKELPAVSVVIEGHTDALGSNAYNMKLSLLRARAVRDYLLDKGIAANRLSVKGYGERSPVAINHNPDGTDNPRGRALNRRCQYKFTGAGAGKIKLLQKIPAHLLINH